MFRCFLRAFICLIFLQSTSLFADRCELILKKENENELKRLLADDVAQLSPNVARERFYAIGSKEIFDLKPIDESPLLYGPDNKPILVESGYLLPQEVKDKLRERMTYMLKLKLTGDDKYNSKAQLNLVEFDKWLSQRDDILFTADNLGDWAREKLTHEQLLKKLTDAFDWDKKNREESRLDRTRGNISNPYLRGFIRGSQNLGRGIKNFATGIATTALAITGTAYFMILIGGDKANSYKQNEANYYMAGFQTSIIEDFQLSRNKARAEGRLEALHEQVKNNSKKILDETTRVLQNFKGLSDEEALHASEKLGEYFAKQRFHSERAFSKNEIEGRSVFQAQYNTPADWMMRINSAYIPFSQKKDTLFQLERELSYAQENLKNPGNLSKDFINSDINKLTTKIAEVKKEMGVFRKQVATMLALWKINELVYPELFVMGPEKMGRGEFYQKAIQEVGYEFYYSTFKDDFKKAAESFGLFLDTGEIDQQFKENIDITITGQKKPN